MVGDVIDGRVILHESPVFKDEESSSDYSIVITLPEIIDGEYVDPTYNNNEFRVEPKGTKYSTHRVMSDDYDPDYQTIYFMDDGKYKGDVWPGFPE